LFGGSDFIYALVFSQDGTQLAAGTATGLMKVWNVDTRREVTPLMLGRGGAIQILAFGPTGVLFATDADRRIVRWDLSGDASVADRSDRSAG
jgi:WD40 repeat protein